MLTSLEPRRHISILTFHLDISLYMCVTFYESDGLLQSVSVFVTIVQNVSANFESGRIQKNWIDLIDCVQHRLPRLFFIEILIFYDILIRKQTE